MPALHTLLVKLRLLRIARTVGRRSRLGHSYRAHPDRSHLLLNRNTLLLNLHWHTTILRNTVRRLPVALLRIDYMPRRLLNGRGVLVRVDIRYRLHHHRVTIVLLKLNHSLRTLRMISVVHILSNRRLHPHLMVIVCRKSSINTGRVHHEPHVLVRVPEEQWLIILLFVHLFVEHILLSDP